MDLAARETQRSEGHKRRRLIAESFCVARGFADELFDGLVAESSEIGEQLAVSHEERPQHFRQGESPQAVANIFDKLIFEKGGESGRTLRIT